jgi:hypothetical protein
VKTLNGPAGRPITVVVEQSLTMTDPAINQALNASTRELIEANFDEDHHACREAADDMLETVRGNEDYRDFASTLGRLRAGLIIVAMATSNSSRIARGTLAQTSGWKIARQEMAEIIDSLGFEYLSDGLA